jgi:superfamily II DNA/RNA helicase
LAPIASLTGRARRPHPAHKAAGASREVRMPEERDGAVGDRASSDENSTKKKRRRRKKKRSGDAKAPSSAKPVYDDDVYEPKKAPRKRAAAANAGGKATEVFSDQTFAELGLRPEVLQGVTDLGFTQPTWIQSQLIPVAITGQDVLGQAKTGSGKTAAFALPVLHQARKGEPFQAFILAPTRELAIQISDEIEELGRHTGLRVMPVYGGQSIRTQAERLQKKPEIVVATPGRLLDMIERGYLRIDGARFAVLDEVDRMLDIGFRDDIRKLLGMIRVEHQTIFVSATISDEIEKLARKYMKDPARVEPKSQSLTVDLVQQHYLSVEPWDKTRLLKHLLTHEEPALTIVFCKTKRTVDKVAKALTDSGIDAKAIHGDMPQSKRNRVIDSLRDGNLSVLIASDLAARGLDVDLITHVINYDIPEDPEVYIHRIGRTARAGRDGVAWSFVTSEQGELLTAVEMLSNKMIPELDYPDFVRRDPPGDWKKDKPGTGGPAKPAQNRLAYVAAPPKPAEKVDMSRFPGGVVPTRMPPRSMGGRVKTHRTMKSAPPGAEAPAPSPGVEPKP